MTIPSRPAPPPRSVVWSARLFTVFGVLGVLSLSALAMPTAREAAGVSVSTVLLRGAIGAGMLMVDFALRDRRARARRGAIAVVACDLLANVVAGIGHGTPPGVVSVFWTVLPLLPLLRGDAGRWLKGNAATDALDAVDARQAARARRNLSDDEPSIAAINANFERQRQRNRERGASDPRGSDDGHPPTQ